MGRLLHLLRRCEEESCVRTLLAQYIGGEEEVKVGLKSFTVFADVIAGNVAFEVKLDGEFYDGWGQALAYLIAGYRPWIFNYLSRRQVMFDAYVEAYNAFTSVLPSVCPAVASRDGRFWYRCPWEW